jgi:tripartite-type tricarboxylate transporter receptor subunit TctC
MPTRRYLIASVAASAVVPGLIRTAQANPWPDRTVHMIVPLAAGGPTDVNARIVAEQLAKIWNQQVVIDNKGGAGTNIGNAFVAHADSDGYTLLFGTSSLASNGALYRSLDYNPLTDLKPVSLVARFPFFMFVPNSSPAKTVPEFIDYVKGQPGKLIIASPGTGSGPHLAELLFMQMAGIQMTHAPYRGAAPAFTDLIPGRVHCYFGSGELLLIRSRARSASLPRQAPSDLRQRRVCRPSPSRSLVMWSTRGKASLPRPRRKTKLCNR